MTPEKSRAGAVAVIKPTEPTPDKATARKLNGKAADRQDPKREIGLAAQVAGVTTYVRNWRLPKAQTHFPFNPEMRTVDKYFQFAKGGPLYVDEPTTEGDIEKCKKKAQVAKIEGIRYCYVTITMKLDEARRQIVESKEKKN
jgi:hypothetical protein